MWIILHNGYRNARTSLLRYDHELQGVHSHAILHYLKMQVVAVAVIPAADQHRVAVGS